MKKEAIGHRIFKKRDARMYRITFNHIAPMFCAVLFLLLAGCTQQAKSESEMIEDLQTNEAFISQDAKITNFEVVKRQTDQEERKDIVHVKVEFSGDQLSGTVSYVLRYELYNEGWLLEHISRDQGAWEYSGLANERMAEDIRSNDYLFSEWDLTVDSIDVTDESCDSNASDFYLKWYNVDLIAHTDQLKYYASYILEYRIENGEWVFEHMKKQSSRYEPLYGPNISDTDSAMLTFDYDEYLYLNTDENFVNCTATVYYTAKKYYELGTENYIVSIPLTLSVENGCGTWRYERSEITETLASAELNVSGYWGAYRDEGTWGDKLSVSLYLGEVVEDSNEPKKFSMQMSYDAFWHNGAWLGDGWDQYAKTNGVVLGTMTWIEHGYYRLDPWSTEDDGSFYILLNPREIYYTLNYDKKEIPSGVYWLASNSWHKLTKE